METAESKRILIVEDDIDIVEAVKLNIDMLGYDLHHEKDGKLGLEKALQGDYLLVILDLVLPRLGGLEICRELRRKKAGLPILMLTSKSDEMSRVLGLELGADDYLTKPFSVMELSARIKALLRRLQLGSQNVTAEEEQTSEIINRGNLTIDIYRRKVSIGKEQIDLTAIEFDLLVILASYPGRAFSKEELIDRVWGYIAAGHERTLTSQMSRLRRKIEIDPDQPKYIKTLWSIGYKFAELAELEDCH